MVSTSTYRPVIKTYLMITTRYSTTEQHEELERVIKEVYGLALKAFISDVAEIVELYSGEDSEMVELLWEASTAD
jgi:hypothetical protein